MLDKNRFTQNAFGLCTAIGLVLFAITKEVVWIGVAVAIGAGLQNQFKKKRDDAEDGE